MTTDIPEEAVDPTPEQTVAAAHDLREAALMLADAINNRTRTIVRLLVAVIILGALAFGATWLQARNSLGFQKRGIGCMLEQQAEHRLTNFESHEQLAGDLGKPLNLSGLQPPQSEAVRKLRAKFGKDCAYFSPQILNQK